MIEQFKRRIIIFDNNFSNMIQSNNMPFYFRRWFNLQQQSKIWIILVALWIINGSSFLAIKVAIDNIPPLLSAGLRFSIAGLILFTLFFWVDIINMRKLAENNGSML